jgi:hypothetical protein
MRGAAKGRFGFYLFLPVRMAASVKIAALPQFWYRTREQMLREQSKKNECRESPASYQFVDRAANGGVSRTGHS